ncbi:hypothetical protein QGN23_01600 [Chryseobacterium gotjawalense]|uniref:Uncharacterized protein n=1 Tax=Chryseobacterium gotjawalense TaxID=3042315 RepID=A0ABY8RG28_9FLAO|nr:hypothetical protein [Chryseobacterium sp. wdc7]WHF51982.1 hypothetical protein QGN23_01600 [Chryseobacterium sp. wdc7]
MNLRKEKFHELKLSFEKQTLSPRPICGGNLINYKIIKIRLSIDEQMKISVIRIAKPFTGFWIFRKIYNYSLLMLNN